MIEDGVVAGARVGEALDRRRQRHDDEHGLLVAGDDATPRDGAPAGAVAVRAPTDGTVYLRPDPSRPAFASEGAALGSTDTVALIEVMKTFTPVRAGLAGRVVRVDVSDGASVQEGAVLAWILA